MPLTWTGRRHGALSNREVNDRRLPRQSLALMTTFIIVATITTIITIIIDIIVISVIINSVAAVVVVVVVIIIFIIIIIIIIYHVTVSLCCAGRRHGGGRTHHHRQTEDGRRLQLPILGGAVGHPHQTTRGGLEAPVSLEAVTVVRVGDDHLRGPARCRRHLRLHGLHQSLDDATPRHDDDFV